MAVKLLNFFGCTNSITVGTYNGTSFRTQNKRKIKTIPLQSRSGPRGSRKLKFLDFMTTAQFVSLTHRPSLSSGKQNKRTIKNCNTDVKKVDSRFSHFNMFCYQSS